MRSLTFLSAGFVPRNKAILNSLIINNKERGAIVAWFANTALQFCLRKRKRDKEWVPFMQFSELTAPFNGEKEEFWLHL